MNQTGKRSWRGIAAVMILSLCITMFGVADADAASGPARPSFKVTKRTKTTATLKIKKKGKVSGYQVYVSGSKKGKYRLIRLPSFGILSSVRFRKIPSGLVVD